MIVILRAPVFGGIFHDRTIWLPDGLGLFFLICVVFMFIMLMKSYEQQQYITPLLGKKRKCFYCSGDAEYECPQCRNAYYCSDQCYNIHWYNHKEKE